MTKRKATHYSEKPLIKWNATDFGRYLADEHERILGIPYVTRSIAAERKLIKLMAEEYGPQTVKTFIDRFLAEYRPTTQYPGTTFFFAYSYVRERLLPQILAEQKRQEAQKLAASLAEETVNGGMSADELEAWL
jgi:hypothetical protein